jgi:fructan beta-fructosidase
MFKNLTVLLALAATFSSMSSNAQTDTAQYSEKYRPQIHFSPKAHWMNDPNGMVFYKGIYHLFFQYYPNGTTWGPMHWGHAESPDMIHWKEMPIALYPDSLGYIFSGSAVVDSNNTSGFGKNGKVPLVAIFTQHDPKGEREGKNNFQNESLAYSLDNGAMWTKYIGNPVLKNPGIRDFRDPKVMWYAPEHKWIMTLATHDHITFFSSPDLKNWQKESEFGKTSGAHGGVWECPDLFPLKLNGKEYWVLIVNVNPGGPNGGSATQYFVGDFNGNAFTPLDSGTRWVDYGPDEYAGITWSNTGNRRIFLGWMSNWEYANQVPTVKWRNAMTIPRLLTLKEVNGKILLASEPVKEIKSLENSKLMTLLQQNTSAPSQYILKLKMNELNDYQIILSNKQGNKVLIGYDKNSDEYYIDRTASGATDFQKDFKGRFTAPRFTAAPNSDVTLVVDAASVELFADNGLTVMTAIFFPDKPMDNIQIKSKAPVRSILTPLKSIWP